MLKNTIGAIKTLENTIGAIKTLENTIRGNNKINVREYHRGNQNCFDCPYRLSLMVFSNVLIVPNGVL
jgi:hypothetical protein